MEGMERDLLARYLSEGLSLRQIGALEGRDPSTVGYWVQKHGLKAVNSERNAPKGGIPRETLEALVDAGGTIRSMSDALAVSESTIVHWLRRHGLQTERARRRGQRPLVAEPLPRVVELNCVHHGKAEHVLEGRGYYRCKRCRKERVAAWRRSTKKRLLMEAGGRCRLCGYDRYAGALEFHHVDPEQKSFGLSVRGITRSLDSLRSEAEKCVLLCSNCHAEVEGGVVALEESATVPT
jgi:transposase-like protein